jgi:hypothetical protein
VREETTPKKKLTRVTLSQIGTPRGPLNSFVQVFQTEDHPQVLGNQLLIRNRVTSD